jgi:hypothetical protein
MGALTNYDRRWRWYCEIRECDEIEATALHEAGHAVIHHLLGNTVSFVTMCDDTENAKVTATKHSDNDWVIGGFAGPWAQQLFSDDPPTQAGCSHDYRLINETLGISSAQDPQVSLREELKERARQMVLANETSIRTVAKHLISHGDIGNPHHSFGQTAAQILDNIIRTSNPLPAE